MTAFWLARRCWRSASSSGIVMSLVQIVTSIQDSAFNAIPRLLAFLGAFILVMPWMLQRMTCLHGRHPGGSEPLWAVNCSSPISDAAGFPADAGPRVRRFRVRAVARY